MLCYFSVFVLSINLYVSVYGNEKSFFTIPMDFNVLKSFISSSFFVCLFICICQLNMMWYIFYEHVCIITMIWYKLNVNEIKRVFEGFVSCCYFNNLYFAVKTSNITVKTLYRTSVTYCCLWIFLENINWKSILHSFFFIRASTVLFFLIYIHREFH